MGKIACLLAWLACASHCHLASTANDATKTGQSRSTRQVRDSDALRSLAGVLAAFNAPVQDSHFRSRHAGALSRQQSAGRTKQNLAIDSRIPQRSAEPRAAAVAAPAKATQGQLVKVLKKRSGALSISLEFNPASGGASSSRDVDFLSMSLRKSKAAAIWTPDLESLAILAKEQAAAKGDYPSPCPVVFTGDSSKAAAAVEAGAAAVVLEPKDLEQANTLEVDVLWHVSSADDVSQIVDAGHGAAFFAAAADVKQIMPALPKDALLVAYLDAMQKGSAEVEKGKELAKAGCHSVLLRNACVGDEEDVEYSRFVVSSLSSKMNTAIKVGVMTGAVNGHFGMGSNFMNSGPKEWKRISA